MFVSLAWVSPVTNETFGICSFNASYVIVASSNVLVIMAIRLEPFCCNVSISSSKFSGIADVGTSLYSTGAWACLTANVI